MTIIDVSALGDLADEKETKYSTEFISRYSKVAKIELVCRDADVEQIVSIIKKKGCTSHPGDGILFVSPIERAVKIRTGEEGENILQT